MRRTGRTRTGTDTDTLWPGRHATWNCSNASVYGSGSGQRNHFATTHAASLGRLCASLSVCVFVCVCLCCVCFMLNNCVHILFVGFLFRFVVRPNTHDDGRGKGGR